MWSGGDNPETFSFIFLFSFKRCTVETLPTDIHHHHRPVSVNGHPGTTTVPGTVFEHCEESDLQGLVSAQVRGALLVLLGSSGARSSGIGMCEVLLCSRRDQSGEVQPPNC